jgi:hypothetical protein
MPEARIERIVGRRVWDSRGQRQQQLFETGRALPAGFAGAARGLGGRPMSEGGELVHFHDWRAARDRTAATRRLWRSRCSGLVTCLSRLGVPPWCWRPACHPSAPGDSQWRRSSAPVVDLPDHSIVHRRRVRRGAGLLYRIITPCGPNPLARIAVDRR